MDKNSKFCRFCLYEEQTDSNNLLVDIFTSPIRHQLRNFECVEFFINPEDNIPPLACDNCLEIIKQLFQFLEKAQISKNILYQIHNPNKQEDPDKIEVIKLVTSRCFQYHENDICESYDSYTQTVENISENECIKSQRRPSITRSCIEPNQKKYLNVRKSTANIYELCNANSSDNEENKVPDAMYFPGGHKINIYKKKLRKFHKNSNIYSCGICSDKFDNFFEYQDHQYSHNGQYVFCCSKCKEVFSTRTEVVQHENNHKVSCVVCNIDVLPKSLGAHMKKHTDLFKCTDCPSRHSSRAALESHFSARHAGVKGCVCHICGKQNSCQASMKRHLATHISTKAFKCKICTFATKSKNVLKVHILRKHSNQTTNCDICKKPFKSDLSLNQHKKRIHQPKIHNCKYCDKTFSERFNLDQHLRKKHSKQRVYECKECNEEFFTVQKLKDHMHSHRTGCVNCQNCGRTFFYKKNFQNHIEKCTSVGSQDVQHSKE